MTVVDRYLMAVRIFLPRSAQRDIIAELSDDIQTRIGDREGTLGRPLSAAEQEAIVAEFGHPALLAGRYGPRRRLIGPEIFPFYWLVLRLALVVGVAVHVAVTITMLAQGRTDQAIRQATQVLPVVAFIQFGIITLVFALLDNYGVLARVGHNWNPRALPTAGRVQPFVQLAFVAIFSAWWFSALRMPFLVFGPGAAVVTFAPIWRSLYLPMVGLALADVAWQIARLLRPQWGRFRSIVRIILCGLELAVLFALAKAGPWVVMADAGHPPSDLPRMIDLLNRCVYWSFPLVAAVSIAVTLREFLALRRGTSPAA
jgi:hypothetical protein